MRKTKILSLIIFSTILFGTIGGVVAYQEYIYRWINDGAGGTHGACHGSANTKASVNGTLVLTVNETGNLSPGQAFTIEVDILNFTEANLSPYDGRVTIGVPGYQGDNAKFTSALSHQTLNRREQVDSYGSYDPGNTNNVFELFAPKTAGTYDLVAVAIAAVNQTDASAYNITFVQDSVQITVVGTSGGGGTISGGLLVIIVGSVFTITTILVVSMRKIIRKKEL
ncbi:MAG: hypothetical protein ACFFE4_20715 [Candidatus Thorarchaeota archaeon]